jgi:hypothetical protein
LKNAGARPVSSSTSRSPSEFPQRFCVFHRLRPVFDTAALHF